MSSAHGPARPRYGRIAALGSAVVVTVLSGLAGTGVLGNGSAAAVADPVVRQAAYQQTEPAAPTGTSPAAPAGTPAAEGRTPTGSSPSGTSSGTMRLGPTGGGRTDAPALVPVPASSGSGRRVVFSQHLQRVWLVGAHGDRVRRTYLVSGSTSDNLQPGTYAISSRERHATGIDGSGRMAYFDIFTAGPTGAAIGFHSIPVKNGHLVQTVAQLGTPQSHGCIRQWKPDAVALWHFAPVGTKVVVVA